MLVHEFRNVFTLVRPALHIPRIWRHRDATGNVFRTSQLGRPTPRSAPARQRLNAVSGTIGFRTARIARFMAKIDARFRP